MDKHNNTEHHMVSNTNNVMNILSYILDDSLDELDSSLVLSEDQLWAAIDSY